MYLFELFYGLPIFCIRKKTQRVQKNRRLELWSGKESLKGVLIYKHQDSTAHQDNVSSVAILPGIQTLTRALVQQKNGKGPPLAGIDSTRADALPSFTLDLQKDTGSADKANL